MKAFAEKEVYATRINLHKERDHFSLSPPWEKGKKKKKNPVEEAG